MREFIPKSMDKRAFIDAYYTTRKNKRRSEDSVLFELHWERDLARLMRELEDHTFSPSAYTFVAQRPRICQLAHESELRQRNLAVQQLHLPSKNGRLHRFDELISRNLQESQCLWNYAADPERRVSEVEQVRPLQ